MRRQSFRVPRDARRGPGKDGTIAWHRYPPPVGSTHVAGQQYVEATNGLLRGKRHRLAKRGRFKHRPRCEVAPVDQRTVLEHRCLHPYAGSRPAPAGDADGSTIHPPALINYRNRQRVTWTTCNARAACGTQAACATGRTARDRTLRREPLRARIRRARRAGPRCAAGCKQDASTLQTPKRRASRKSGMLPAPHPRPHRAGIHDARNTRRPCGNNCATCRPTAFLPPHPLQAAACTGTRRPPRHSRGPAAIRPGALVTALRSVSLPSTCCFGTRELTPRAMATACRPGSPPAGPRLQAARPRRDGAPAPASATRAGPPPWR